MVYVKYDDHFSAMNNYYVADDIERINRQFLAEGKNYVLIGPGRWGSSDHYLGVPVKWPHISAARVIVEVALKNYNVAKFLGIEERLKASLQKGNSKEKFLATILHDYNYYLMELI